MADHTFQQKRLGKTLQRLRERTGMTQRDAAKALRWNYQKLSRIEHGQVPDLPQLKALLDLYGIIVSEEAPYLDLWERANEKGWWHPYCRDSQGYISLEHDASKVCEFQLGYIPGLLQIEEYARAVFSGAQVQRSRGWIENQVTIRMLRQKRLTGENPLQLHVIIAEAAFRQASRAQLLHINERGRLPNVTVQVLLDEAGMHDGQNGSFTLLDFPYQGDPQVLYIEHRFGSEHIEDPARVKASRLVFKHLSKLALTPDESAAWIERLAAER